jgi:ArsR family transcriptional regulator
MYHDRYIYSCQWEVEMAKRVATLELDAAVRDAVAQCCPSVLASPLDATEAAQLALGFTALADPVRLQVLSILAAAPDGEVCVCDFVEPLGKSQPTVSHHMKILADAGLVHGERRSKWVYYSLDRGRLASLRAAIDS